MDPSLVYQGPFTSAEEAKSARWMLLFPLDEVRRLEEGRPEPGDLQALQAAIVQGVLENLPDAFTWRKLVEIDRRYR
jgi:hypothetical protein